MSANLNLTPLEVRDLITRYKSELRKLEYQIQKVQSTITELTASLPEEDPVLATVQMGMQSVEEQAPAKKSAAAPARPKAKRGRKPKAKTTAASKKETPAPVEEAAAPAAEQPQEEAKAAPRAKKTRRRKAGRPKKETAKAEKPRTRQTKLNDWDQMVMDAVEQAGKMLIAGDFIEMGKKKVEAENLGWSEGKVKAKINQTLHKLANKKELLAKIDFEGRGYSYGLKSWLTKKGDMPKKYQR